MDVYYILLTHGSSFGAQGSSFGAQGSSFGAHGSSFGAQGSGSGAQGSAFAWLLLQQLMVLDLVPEPPHFLLAKDKIKKLAKKWNENKHI